MKIDANTTLCEVFERHYNGRQLLNPRPDTLRHWRRQLTRLNRAIGRDAVVSDLSEATVAKAETWLRREGYSASTIRVFTRHVKTLWQFLFDKGAVRTAAPGRYWTRPAEFHFAAPQSETLFGAFQSRMAKRKGAPLSSEEQRDFRWAIRWMCRSLKRQAAVDDLNEPNLQRVTDAMMLSVRGDTVICKFRLFARRLWAFLHFEGVIAAPPPDEGTYIEVGDGTKTTNWGKAAKKRLARGAAKKRLITIPQVAVEEMKLTDPLIDLANAYIARRLRGAAPHTRYKYGRMIVNELEFFLGRPPTIGDLFSNENVEGVVWQVRENGREIASSNTYGHKLCALWRWAADRGLCRFRPDVELIPEPKRVPIGWDRMQLARLWQACTEQRGMIADVPASAWLVALHCFLWDSGERIGAALSARFENLDSAGWLKIPAESRKGKREDKVFLLHPDTLAAIERIREPRRERIFPWPFHNATLYHRYKTMLRRAGLPNDRKHMFHCLRKTAGSFVKAAGLDPTEFLGHADAETTKVYMVPSIIGTRQASQVLFRPGAMRPAALIGAEGSAP